MKQDDFYLNDDEKNDALNDDGQELTNEFLFDEKNFQTLVIQTKENNQVKQILDVDKFIKQYNNISEKNDLLLWLKQNNYKDLLIEQIQETSDKDILSKLIAAYWEAGFSDHKHLNVFVPYLLSDDFYLSLEAYSAILGLDKSFEKQDAEQAIQMIQSKYNNIAKETIHLIDEILDVLKSSLSDN